MSTYGANSPAALRWAAAWIACGFAVLASAAVIPAADKAPAAAVARAKRIGFLISVRSFREGRGKSVTVHWQ
ncbi:hypothetical protein GCM10017688_43920 [Streptomyces ramulosus]